MEIGVFPRICPHNLTLAYFFNRVSAVLLILLLQYLYPYVTAVNNLASVAFVCGFCAAFKTRTRVPRTLLITQQYQLDKADMCTYQVHGTLF